MSQKFKDLEQEMIDQVCGPITQREMDVTSKYDSNKKQQQQSNLEKTTPRGSKACPIDSDVKRKAKPQLIPKLPLYNIGAPSRITPLSRANNNFSLFNQSSIEKNDSQINDSQIVPPPCMLNDQFGEWDSMLDDTKIQVCL